MNIHGEIKEDLRGLFFIIKGNYKNVAPKVACGDGIERFIGGYNPTDSEDWYIVLDTETFFCSYAGGNYERALEVIYNQIVYFKSRKRYFKWVSEHTSEDYYFIHYLGRAPFSKDEHMKRCEGRVPRVSVPQKHLYRAIYNEYGHYFDDDIQIKEDDAHDVIQDKLQKSKGVKPKIKLKPSLSPVQLVKPIIPLDLLQAPNKPLKSKKIINIKPNKLKPLKLK